MTLYPLIKIGLGLLPLGLWAKEIVPAEFGDFDQRYRSLRKRT